MRIAIVGAGYVADFYAMTLANHSHLSVAGVWDSNPDRLARFCATYGFAAYAGLDALLADASVGIIVNLVSAKSHFDVTHAALSAGRHVYSEKPLALHLDEAVTLVALAKERGVMLASAPANMLGPACQTVAQLIAAGKIGTPRLAYAQMEDGPVFRQNWQRWQSRSGAPWPGWDEFEVGCTLEHAGYALSWLITLFGGVDRVVSQGAVVHGDKGQASGGQLKARLGPDFSSGVLQFENRMIARLTCGLVAPRDHGLTIFGDLGTITVADLRDSLSAVYLNRKGKDRGHIARVLAWVERRAGLRLSLARPLGRRQRLTQAPTGLVLPDWPSRIDFAAGIADLARAIRLGTVPQFANDAALHLAEVTLRLDGAAENLGEAFATAGARVVHRWPRPTP